MKFGCCVSVSHQFATMKQILLYITLCFTLGVFAQNEVAELEVEALKKSNGLVYEGNNLVADDFVSAEMEYRKAISEKPNNAIADYNLGNAYFNTNNFEEGMLRYQQAIKNATSKTEKHRAYHNMGNALMQGKLCKEAVEAFKGALRNNPKDDESRYNLALAKECAKQQQDQNGDGGDDDKNEDQNDDKQENENKDQKDEGDNKDKDNKDEGDNKENEDKEGDDKEKEGEDKEDENGKPKDEKKDQGKEGDNKQKQQPKPQQGQLSPQQVKNLLEAMNNQEQKVQEKMNAQKAKGVRVQTDKDW